MITSGLHPLNIILVPAGFVPTLHIKIHVLIPTLFCIYPGLHSLYTKLIPAVFWICPWPALPVHCADSWDGLYLSVACTPCTLRRLLQCFVFIHGLYLSVACTPCTLRWFLQCFVFIRGLHKTRGDPRFLSWVSSVRDNEKLCFRPPLKQRERKIKPAIHDQTLLQLSTPYFSFQQHIVVVVHFYTALFSTLEQTHCACMWFSHEWLAFYSTFFFISTEVVYLWCWHGWCHVKLLLYRRIPSTPYIQAPCHFMQSHICKVHGRLAVTCKKSNHENKTLLRWNVHVVLQQHKKSKHGNKNIVKMKYPCCFTTQAHKKSEHGNKNTVKMKCPCCFTITQVCTKSEHGNKNTIKMKFSRRLTTPETHKTKQTRKQNKNNIKMKFPRRFTTPETRKKSKHGNKTKTLLRWNVHVVLQHKPCELYILNRSKARTL